MRELLSQLGDWHDSGAACAVARVVRTDRSAPRPPGATMALGPNGEVAGSVSGGCVEAAVVELAQRTLADGVLRRAQFGYSDQDALAVGLTCGGEIEVIVERLDSSRWGATPGEVFNTVRAAVSSTQPIALATVIGLAEGDGAVTLGGRMVITPTDVHHTLGASALDAAVASDARRMLNQGITQLRDYGTQGEHQLSDVEVFVESFAPPPTMLVFGAIDYGTAVTSIGHFLGYHVTVCDAREMFATRRRFPDADEVVVEWPHRYLDRTPTDERTVICVLTHDSKFDVPVLERALRRPAAYVGALGSRRTHIERLERLRKAGLTDDELVRLRSPIGLDLGGRTPEEAAVSIAAEIVALRYGGSGAPLIDTDGPLHGTATPVLP